MKRFEGIHIKEVGVFKDVQIEFPEKRLKDKAEIHIFTGLNGSGKTTLLECLIGLFHKSSQFLNKTILDSTVIDIFFGNEKHEYKTQNIVSEDVSPNLITFIHDQLTKKPQNVFELLIALNSKQLDNYNHNITLNYSAFCYSGKRSIKNRMANNQANEYNSLYEALNLEKTQVTDYLLLQWIQEAITKKALAALNGKIEKAKKYGKIVQTIEQIISDITNSQIKFKLLDNPLKVIIEENGQEVDFETLSDGLKSLISWIADLLLRLERTPWEGDVPVLERNFILFLDEIEIHLHPSLQRKVLPIVQKLFPNAQIFVSTHSPFVVGSVSDAWVYKLELNNGVTTISDPIPSKAGYSFHNILDEIFNVDEEFDVETEQLLDEFYNLKARLLKGLTIDEAELDKLVKELSQKSVEVKDIVAGEMQQLKRVQQKR